MLKYDCLLMYFKPVKDKINHIFSTVCLHLTYYAGLIIGICRPSVQGFTIYVGSGQIVSIEWFVYKLYGKWISEAH